MAFPRTRRSTWTVALVPLAAWACAAELEPRALGPVDGHALPATDLERVRVGTTAPDFVLEAYSGDTVALSDYRGGNVVLVFYRGHW